MNNSIEKSMILLLNRIGRHSVWYGDIDIIEECAKISGIKVQHPKKNIERILNGLENSPFFKKSYIESDFSGAKRKYRCFTLRETDPLSLKDSSSHLSNE